MVENGENFDEVGKLIEVKRFSNKEKFYETALNFIVDLMNETLKRKNTFTLVLAGGRTPVPLYDRLSKCELPWDRIHLFWGDERFLPQNEAGNNFRVAYEVFISKIKIPSENIHRIKTEFSSAEVCALNYENELLKFFGTVPEFDLTLLGMGEDGHTASIFPKSPIIKESKRLVVPTPPHGDPKVPRITLTLKAINNSKNIIFLISGENKRKIFERIIKNSEEYSQEYPASLVKGKEKTIWFVN